MSVERYTARSGRDDNGSLAEQHPIPIGHGSNTDEARTGACSKSVLRPCAIRGPIVVASSAMFHFPVHRLPVIFFGGIRDSVGVFSSMFTEETTANYCAADVAVEGNC
jgi:hypothetical protein